MTDTDFNEPVFRILYNYLKSSSCLLKDLVSFLCDKCLFFELSQNYNLELLNLSSTFLSHSEVEMLCGILNQAECNIQILAAAACDLSPDLWLRPDQKQNLEES